MNRFFLLVVLLGAARCHSMTNQDNQADSSTTAICTDNSKHHGTHKESWYSYLKTRFAKKPGEIADLEEDQNFSYIDYFLRSSE